jgi:hypothetical protein
VFEPEVKQGELVELALDSDFQYECWMMALADRQGLGGFFVGAVGAALKKKRGRVFRPGRSPKQNSTT